MLREVYSTYRLWVLGGAVVYLLAAALAALVPELRNWAWFLRLLSGTLFMLDGVLLTTNWQGVAEECVGARREKKGRAGVQLTVHRLIGLVFIVDGLGFIVVASLALLGL